MIWWRKSKASPTPHLDDAPRAAVVTLSPEVEEERQAVRGAIRQQVLLTAIAAAEIREALAHDVLLEVRTR